MNSLFLLRFSSNPTHPSAPFRYADRNTRVTFVYPPKGNEITISKPMHLLSDPLRGPFVKKAIALKRPVLQGPFELRQGGMGVVVRLPTFEDGQFIGLAIGVYDLNKLVGEALSGIDLKAYSMELTDGNGKIFWGRNSGSGNSVTKNILLNDIEWEMTLEHVEALSDPPGVTRVLIWILGCGVLFAAVFLIFLLSSQAGRLKKTVEDRTNQLVEANDKLLDKIREIELAEKSLRKSEERFRKIVEFSGAGYFFIDRDGMFREVNAAWLKLHGYTSKEEIIGRHYSITRVNQDHEEARRDLERLITNSPIPTDEGSRLLKDGSIGYHTYTASPVEENGEIVGLDGFVIDITKRKIVEEAQGRLKMCLEGLWEITRLADEDYKVIYDNILEEIVSMTESRYAFYGFVNEDETAMELYSWSEEAVSDCRIKDIPMIFPIGRAGLWADAIRQRQPLIHNDYNARWAGKSGLPAGHVNIDRLATVPVFIKNRIAAVAAVANKPDNYTEDDIRQIETFLGNAQILLERKKAQDQIKSSLKEKEILLKEIHHRVKNNMQSISSLLNIQARKEKDERVREALREGINRIEAMAAAHEATYQSETLGDISLNHYVRSLKNRVLDNMRSSGTVPDFDIQIPDNIILPTKMAAQLGLVLNEILVNALKYAFPAGHDGKITIKGELRAEQIRLTIRDNGIGLPADFDWDNIETLGLSLIKGLIEQQLEGAVEISGREGPNLSSAAQLKKKENKPGARRFDRSPFSFRPDRFDYRFRLAAISRPETGRRPDRRADFQVIGTSRVLTEKKTGPPAV